MNRGVNRDAQARFKIKFLSLNKFIFRFLGFQKIETGWVGLKFVKLKPKL